MLLQVILLSLVALAGILGGDAWQGTPAAVSALAGLALMLGGALLAARGMLDLGRNLTPVPRPRDDAQLVETGIYALVRHPIYGGIIVAAVGWGALLASPAALLLAGLLAVFFHLKSRREEAWLATHYSGYLTYVSRTRRFIPWLY